MSRDGEDREASSAKHRWLILMKKEFSFYEFVGVIVPGAVFLIIVAQAFPEIGIGIDTKGLSVGGFGVFAIIAYALGHLLQSVGNIIEKIWWTLFGGMPTNWVIKDTKKLYLSEEQLQTLLQNVADILHLKAKKALRDYSQEDWVAISRQIYAAVRQANATDRVDIFNGNYGFFRGIAASLLIGIVVLIVKSGITHWELLVVVACFLAMAIARMHRFGKHYARELYVQFIQIKK